MEISLLKNMVGSDSDLSYLSIKVPNGFRSFLFLRDDSLENLKISFNVLPRPVVSCRRSSGQWVFDDINVEDVERNLIDGTAHLYFFEFGNRAIIYVDAAEGTIVLLVSGDLVDRVRHIYGEAALPNCQREVFDKLIASTSGQYRDKALMLKNIN